jgi:hypothetical protein
MARIIFILALFLFVVKGEYIITTPDYSKEGKIFDPSYIPQNSCSVEKYVYTTLDISGVYTNCAYSVYSQAEVNGIQKYCGDYWVYFTPSVYVFCAQYNYLYPPGTDPSGQFVTNNGGEWTLYDENGYLKGYCSYTDWKKGECGVICTQDKCITDGWVQFDPAPENFEKLTGYPVTGECLIKEVEINGQSVSSYCCDTEEGQVCVELETNSLILDQLITNPTTSNSDDNSTTENNSDDNITTAQTDDNLTDENATTTTQTDENSTTLDTENTTEGEENSTTTTTGTTENSTGVITEENITSSDSNTTSNTTDQPTGEVSDALKGLAEEWIKFRLNLFSGVCDNATPPTEEDFPSPAWGVPHPLIVTRDLLLKLKPTLDQFFPLLIILTWAGGLLTFFKRSA